MRQYPKEDAEDLERIAAEIINWVIYVQAKYELADAQILMAVMLVMKTFAEERKITEDLTLKELLAHPVLDRRH